MTAHNNSDTCTTSNPSLNPLQLPEVIVQLGYYLEGSDLINAFLVNHTWHSLLEPFLWHTTKLPSEWALERTPDRYPSRESIRRNCHWIRSLFCPESPLLKELVPACTNLQVLEINIVTQMIILLLYQNAHSLVSLTRQATVHQPTQQSGLQLKLFTAIASLIRLQHLRLERLEVTGEERDAFLETCQRLETLFMTAFIWNIPDTCPIEFPFIQQLTFIKNKMNPTLELEFVARCPKVRFFRWQPTRGLPKEQTTYIQTLLHTRLKSLRTLAIPYAALKDRDIAVIVQALPSLVNLHARSSQFGALSAMAIAESKANIQELDICECEGASSEMVQSILTSCPDLETFGGDVFDMKDLEEGEWRCRRLKKLHLSIMSSRGHEARPNDHAKMYDQLAALTELTVLNLGDVSRVAGGWYNWLELTLSSGLGRLSPLTSLEYLTVGRIHPPLGKAEQAWIQSHLPGVEVLGAVVD